MALPAYEKLGAFYLGKEMGDDGKVGDDLVLYDAKDLTTHAMCVGMTGSGKTGLCLGLLEEALIDGIPAIAIDPKGDLGNLLLTFPGLSAAEFEPWIDPAEATRKGQTVPAYAKKTADLWRNGLASWGQDAERIKRLRASADFAIYTPGSSAGLPLTVLKSFNAPAPAVRDDADALRERVSSAVSGVLGLLGVDADPIRSREHILLSSILDRAWREGRNMTIGDMIQAIQQPGIRRIGVIDLDAFFPPKDRFELAMTLNNLLASPGFSAWLEGEPMDVQRLLWTAEGKPRLAVISIAHLNDQERMFFVTLLLNEVVSWMRAQPGSSSLRALLYMDEVFGFLPPTANPPSKLPMLTLLKQARAFGLGLVLATQNPVDLDYKALSNMGTWFLGRLQTERDKMRILDGLEGASTAASQTFDRKKVEATISGLRSRVFLLNNVHEDAPVLFHTRWVMSYLRGPLTRSQIKLLMSARPPATVVPGAAAPTKVSAADKKGNERPLLPPGVDERFVAVARDAGEGQKLVYRPGLYATGRLHYVAARQDVDTWTEFTKYTELKGTKVPPNPWEKAGPFGDDVPQFEDAPDEDAGYARLPPAATNTKTYTAWKKALVSALYQNERLPMWKCTALKLVSDGGESEGDFRVRCRQALRERRDLEIEKIRKRYGSKAERLQERIRKAEQKVETQQAQYESAKKGTLLRIGETILSVLFGRKKMTAGTIGKASTTMRGMGRAGKEKQDVEQAQADLKEYTADLQALEKELEDAVDTVKDRWDEESLELEAAPVKPRKSDIGVDELALIWTPWVVDESGGAEAAF